MRLFVAIDLPDEVRHAVAGVQEQLRRTAAGETITWVRPPQLHITLMFLGEIPEPQVAAVAGAMTADVPAPSFDIMLGGVGMFPSRGAPRVLWLGLARGGEQVATLSREAAARMAPHQLRPDDRPFHPHVTLGRWKCGGRPAVRGALSRTPIDLTVPVTVERMTLFASRLGPGGPTYTALAHANLRHP